ncbi:hypothetical protein ACF073_07520 [Streptomyces sp. NPDC015171]
MSHAVAAGALGDAVARRTADPVGAVREAADAVLGDGRREARARVGMRRP